MIAIPQAMARQYRAAAKKCINGRARAPDPDVVIRQTKGKLTLTANFIEVVLQLALPAQSDGEDVLVVPMSGLDVILEAKADAVEIHCKEKSTGEVRFLEENQPRSRSIQLVAPRQQHEPPTQPKELISVPAGFLKALHECGRSTTHETGRFALHCLQVRGKQGQVVGTDGRQALIYKGFRFSFGEELLLPAIPLFGWTDLQDQDVRLGRTATHLVVSAGPWDVWLAIQTSGRFPDVASIVPRQSTTLARIDLQDATASLNDLSGLPEAKEEDRPVTLDLDKSVTIRWHDSQSQVTQEVILGRSLVEGPPVRLALDRRILARALSLGCLTLRVTPTKPLVAEGEGMTFLAMPLDPDLIVHPIVPRTENATPVASTPMSQSTPPVPLPQRRDDMRPNDPNNRSTNGRTEQPPPTEAVDPLVLAEELRIALSEATLKASRLVMLLKSGRKEKKVLASVFAGLKQLNLNGTQP